MFSVGADTAVDLYSNGVGFAPPGLEFGAVIANHDTLLDSVSNIALSTPEPSTWAMMVLGFAGLGFAGYRKARKLPRSPSERSDLTKWKAALLGGFFVGFRRRRPAFSGRAARAEQ